MPWRVRLVSGFGLKEVRSVASLVRRLEILRENTLFVAWKSK